MESLIKEASLEGFKKALSVSKVPALLAFDVLAGSAAGSLYSDYIKNRGVAKKTFADAQKIDLVDTKSFIKKIDPSVLVLTSRSDVDKSNLTKIEKLQVKRSIPENGDIGNAHYMETDSNQGIIVAPKKSNKYVLGHELGHRADYAKNRITFEETIPLFGEDIGNLTGKNVGRELAAWEKTPIKEKSESQKELMEKALKTYSDSQKYGRRGAAIFGGLGLFSAASPLIIKAIKRAKGL